MLPGGILQGGSDQDPCNGRAQLSAVEPRAGAGSLRAQIFHMDAIGPGLRSAAGQVGLHHQHRFLVAGFRGCQVGTPLPVIHRCQNLTGGDALAFMNIDRGHIAIAWRGDGDPMLRRHNRVSGNAHGEWTEDKE